MAANHGLYVGLSGGYGSTTWDGLVPVKANQNPALMMSTPTEASEGGSVYGVFAGYNLTPYIGLEASYTKYPKANIVFDSTSLFSFDHDGLENWTTRTESVALTAKIMAPISTTRFKLFSTAGAAKVHRDDLLLNDWRINPTFGVGLNVDISSHVFAEIGGNYTAGFGESQLNPSDSYFPFLYSAFLRLAYCY